MTTSWLFTVSLNLLSYIVTCVKLYEPLEPLYLNGCDFT